MMKWWGWGRSNFEFPMAEKPTLWPWIRNKVGLKEEHKTPVIDRSKIKLEAPLENSVFLNGLKTCLKPHQVSQSEDDRIVHAYGKSYPDLFRARRGEFRRPPDVVVFPESHDDVEAVVRLANEHNVVVVPFGGGTNIVGCVEPDEDRKRMVCTVSLSKMNRLLHVDSYSCTATIQAGALGPKLESDLEAKGFALGHFPDSFEHSTLGGWIATRSAGMQSDAYGKIEDMVVALKVVTPAGVLRTITVPAASSGPDMNRFVIGSEGILGIITEATMRVHPSPPQKDYMGFLFRSFKDGTQAAYECAHCGIAPSMIRLQDEGETQLALHLKSPKKGLEAWIQKQAKVLLKIKGYTQPSIMLIGFEGLPHHVEASKKECLKIIAKHGGFSLGSGVGKTWSKDKFNVPYLRDFVMNYGAMVDVSETSTTWSNLLNLHSKVLETIQNKFASEFGTGYLGCHISHTYKTGACLYFTYAAPQVPGKELEQYYAYKKAITDTITQHGGTLSHHHAVGYDHKPWVRNEITPTGVAALKALKNAWDPNHIMNPGKLIPSDGDELPPPLRSLAVKPPAESWRASVGHDAQNMPSPNP